MNNHFIHVMLADVFELQDKLDCVLLKEYHDKLVSNFVMNFRQKMLSKAYANVVDIILHKYEYIDILDIQHTISTYLSLLEQDVLMTPIDINKYFDNIKKYISCIASHLMSVVVSIMAVHDDTN